LFFKAHNQYYNDWESYEKSPSKKSVRKSQKRKTSFSIKGSIIPERKRSMRLSHDNHAFEEERQSIRSGFGRSRQSIPVDRDSVLNANLRNSMLPTLSQKIDKQSGNFAWID
jgi:hypothetical protein